MANPRPTLTDLVVRAESGDAAALRDLFDATYDDLRVLARARLRSQRGGALLDTTAPVHDCHCAQLSICRRRPYRVRARARMCGLFECQLERQQYLGRCMAIAGAPARPGAPLSARASRQRIAR